MKKALLIFGLVAMTTTLFGQEKPKTCFDAWESVFKKRGAYAINDDMHRKVVVSFFEADGSVSCYTGKVRVEGGTISSVFIKYEDETFYLLDKKFYASTKGKPRITNGISEMIFTDDNERFKVLFIEQIRPQKKSYKPAPMPEDFID